MGCSREGRSGGSGAGRRLARRRKWQSTRSQRAVGVAPGRSQMHAETRTRTRSASRWGSRSAAVRRALFGSGRSRGLLSRCALASGSSSLVPAASPHKLQRVLLQSTSNKYSTYSSYSTIHAPHTMSGERKNC